MKCQKIMDLNEYLKAIRECPDERVRSEEDGYDIARLTAEFGIYDNFDILLRATPVSVLRFLREAGYIRLPSEEMLEHLDGYQASNPEGSVGLGFDNSVPDIGITLGKDSGELRDHQERQRRDFNVNLHIHPTIKPRELLREERVLVSVVDEIGKWALRDKIPLCFSDSIGWNHRGDYSRIVYFNPDA